MRPGAPQLRLALATAQLATEQVALAQPALTNLKAALLVEDDDPTSWYEAAQAYSMLGNEPMANLAVAEQWYNIGDMRKALVFASRHAYVCSGELEKLERDDVSSSAARLVGVATATLLAFVALGLYIGLYLTNAPASATAAQTAGGARLWQPGAGARRVDRPPALLVRTLYHDLGDRGLLEFLVQDLADLDVFVQQLAVLALAGEPARVPGPVDAETQPDRIDLLTHRFLPRP